MGRGGRGEEARRGLADCWVHRVTWQPGMLHPGDLYLWRPLCQVVWLGCTVSAVAEVCRGDTPY